VKKNLIDILQEKNTIALWGKLSYFNMFPFSNGGKKKGSILCTSRLLLALSSYILIFKYEFGCYSHLHYMHLAVNITSTN